METEIGASVIVTQEIEALVIVKEEEVVALIEIREVEEVLVIGTVALVANVIVDLAIEIGDMEEIVTEVLEETEIEDSVTVIEVAAAASVIVIVALVETGTEALGGIGIEALVETEIEAMVEIGQVGAMVSTEKVEMKGDALALEVVEEVVVALKIVMEVERMKGEGKTFNEGEERTIWKEAL